MQRKEKKREKRRVLRKHLDMFSLPVYLIHIASELINPGIVHHQPKKKRMISFKMSCCKRKLFYFFDLYVLAASFT